MLHSRRQTEHFPMTSLMLRGLTAAALIAAFCVANAASAQEGNSPLSAIGRMFGQKPPQTAGQDESDGPTTEQVLRIERLEAQIRQMTGTIEQLQYRNQQLENQLRAAGGGAPGVSRRRATGAVAAPTDGPAPGPGPALAAQRRRHRPRQDAAPTCSIRRRIPMRPGVPRPLGSMPNEPPPIVTAEPPVGAPGGRRAGAPLDLSTLSGVPGSEAGVSPDGGQLPPPPSRNLSATGAVAAVAPPSDSAKDTYDLGYGYVLRKDYALAEDTFQAFLKKYPTDRRAAEAEFWLGESLFQRQRYDAAAQAFLDLSTKHSGHAKAPEALLRLAQSLAAMKQKEMSCATLAEVGRKYPKASATVKQGVEREQKRVRC